MRSFSKKRVIATLTVLAVLVSAVSAYAYWTTTGLGTGSASVANSNGTITLHASFAGGLTPGASEPVSFTADNPATSSLYVGTVTSVVSIDSQHSGCLASDFTVPAVAENQRIAAGATGVALANNSSITFADTDANQDACKGATVTLTLSSN
jgi:hypothetical protein